MGILWAPGRNPSRVPCNQMISPVMPAVAWLGAIQHLTAALEDLEGQKLLRQVGPPLYLLTVADRDTYMPGNEVKLLIEDRRAPNESLRVAETVSLSPVCIYPNAKFDIKATDLLRELQKSNASIHGQSISSSFTDAYL
jgi:hypothetical protein